MTWIRWKWIMKWVTTRNRSCGKLRFAAAIILQPEFSVWASIRQRQRRALCLHALRGQLVYEERFDQTNRQRDGCLSSLSMRIFIVRYTREIREAHERKFIFSTWEIGPSSHRSRRARELENVGSSSRKYLSRNWRDRWKFRGICCRRTSENWLSLRENSKWNVQFYFRNSVLILS